MAFLSEEWFETLAGLTGSLPPASTSGAVDLAVATAPRKETHVHWSYHEGVPGEGSVGAAESPDLMLSLGAADVGDLLSGHIDPSVAFMRGRLKASGDNRLLLAFLSSTSGGRWRDWAGRAAGLELPDRAI